MEKIKSIYRMIDEILKENEEKLEKTRSEYYKQGKKIDILAGVLFFLIFITGITLNFIHINGYVISLIYIIMLIISLVVIKKSDKEQTTGHILNFKENIIRKILENIFEDVKYYPLFGMTRDEYRFGGWRTDFTYTSSDRIVININVVDDNQLLKVPLIISEVKATESESPVIAGYIQLPKSIECKIKFTRKSDIINNTDLDFDEFEKEYDVKTDNKLKAMQIFTHDVMMSFVEKANRGWEKYEYSIVNDMVYFKFDSGAMLELAKSLNGQKVNITGIGLYLEHLVEIKETTEKLCNIIMKSGV